MIGQRPAFSQKNSRESFLLLLIMSISVSACVEMELNGVPGLPMTLDETETSAVMRDLSVSISAIEDAGI